jgi:tRNA(fMet)-specific endonuclease VapC
MRFLLDTNICIAIIRGKSPRAVQRLTQHPIIDMGLSSITVAELEYGVQRSTDKAKNQQALQQFLIPFTFLDFDIQSTQVYGQIRFYLESQGMTIGSLDMLLAAQALAYNLTMVTNNVSEFARVPNLHIEDWTQP